MHLADLLARRPVPAAAVFLTLTRRCPLRCRHCSTMSELTSEQLPAALLRRFVSTFTPADHPGFLLMTGGEPLLRPRLVREIALTARAAGTASYVLTGAFFAARETTPATVRAALTSVDHVAVSVDRFHEQQVPRQRVFRLLRELLDLGTDVSIQACGAGPGDRYIAALTRQVRTEFGDRVPILVSRLEPAGRARAWLTQAAPGPAAPGPAAAPAAARPAPLPCDMAAWPVVGFDGTIVACCNADVLAPGAAPPHLRLGHIATTTWPQLRQACVTRPVLRALRTQGPLCLAREQGAAAADHGGYCATCRALPARRAGADSYGAHTHGAGRLDALEELTIALQVQAGPAAFVRRHGDPELAGLTVLGWERAC